MIIIELYISAFGWYRRQRGGAEPDNGLSAEWTNNNSSPLSTHAPRVSSAGYPHEDVRSRAACMDRHARASPARKLVANFACGFLVFLYCLRHRRRLYPDRISKRRLPRYVRFLRCFTARRGGVALLPPGQRRHLSGTEHDGPWSRFQYQPRWVRLPDS